MSEPAASSESIALLGSAASLRLSVDEVLSTTRAVRRRLDLDTPVPLELVTECIQLATQAPTGSNAEKWHWVVVTDPDIRREVGRLYREAFRAYSQTLGFPGRSTTGDAARDVVQGRVAGSGQYLADHLAEVPVLVLPCMEGRADGLPTPAAAGFWGSLLPAVWSFCLAARERGLGTSWTTLHLHYEQEVAAAIGIPYEHFTQGALIPLAYTVGTDFRSAPRRDLSAVLHINAW